MAQSQRNPDTATLLLLAGAAAGGYELLARSKLKIGGWDPPTWGELFAGLFGGAKGKSACTNPAQRYSKKLGKCVGGRTGPTAPRCDPAQNLVLDPKTGTCVPRKKAQTEPTVKPKTEQTHSPTGSETTAGTKKDPAWIAVLPDCSFNRITKLLTKAGGPWGTAASREEATRRCHGLLPPTGDWEITDRRFFCEGDAGREYQVLRHTGTRKTDDRLLDLGRNHPDCVTDCASELPDQPGAFVYCDPGTGKWSIITFDTNQLLAEGNGCKCSNGAVTGAPSSLRALPADAVLPPADCPDKLVHTSDPFCDDDGDRKVRQDWTDCHNAHPWSTYAVVTRGGCLAGGAVAVAELAAGTAEFLANLAAEAADYAGAVNDEATATAVEADAAGTAYEAALDSGDVDAIAEAEAALLAALAAAQAAADEAVAATAIAQQTADETVALVDEATAAADETQQISDEAEAAAAADAAAAHRGEAEDAAAAAAAAAAWAEAAAQSAAAATAAMEAAAATVATLPCAVDHNNGEATYCDPSSGTWVRYVIDTGEVLEEGSDGCSCG